MTKANDHLITVGTHSMFGIWNNENAKKPLMMIWTCLLQKTIWKWIKKGAAGRDPIKSLYKTLLASAMPKTRAQQHSNLASDRILRLRSTETAMYNRIGRRRDSGVHDVPHGMFHRVYRRKRMTERMISLIILFERLVCWFRIWLQSRLHTLDVNGEATEASASDKAMPACAALSA